MHVYQPEKCSNNFNCIFSMAVRQNTKEIGTRYLLLYNLLPSSSPM